MQNIVTILTATFIISALLISLLYNTQYSKYVNSLQLLFMGLAVLLISFSTKELFYKSACILIGLLNIITSAQNIIKIRKGIVKIII
jgi:hypothetical protein